MCLHDFDDMSAAVAEAARILTPGGRFAVALHHPFVTAKFAWQRRRIMSYAHPHDEATCYHC
jgi:ubiquinone/menaquinone biosynthesis C-methylase UbiE